jgi:hypothetical protein
VAIEDLYSDRLDKLETLAFNAERAEDWHTAVDYLIKSGDKAISAFAVAPAIGFYDRALAAAERAGRPLGSDRAVALHHSRGHALFVSDAWLESVESFSAMRRAAQETGNQWRPARHPRYWQAGLVARMHHLRARSGRIQRIPITRTLRRSSSKSAS